MIFALALFSVLGSLAFAQYGGYGGYYSTSIVPTQHNNTSTTTVETIAAAVPSFTLYSINTISVNATRGGTTTVKAPDGVNITAVIPAGTYAKIGNSLLASYNFSISTFTTANVTAPSSNSTYAVAYGFAFEVNSRITTNYTFVNSSGANRPLTTYAKYPSTWTSWAWLNGAFNGTSYTGGAYAVQNKWSYNGTTGTLTNTQFIKPVMWVFLIAPPPPTTTAASTSVVPSPTTTAPAPPPTTPASSNALLYAGAAVVIIIIIIAALALRRKR